MPKTVNDSVNNCPSNNVSSNGAADPVDLPDFDTLRHMAEQDPDGLEDLRLQLVEQLISSAPEAYHRRLRGLQFQIDMERRKAGNPVAACIKLSAMMHNSFEELRHSLNEAAGTLDIANLQPTSPIQTEAPAPSHNAKVLTFRSRAQSEPS